MEKLILCFTGLIASGKDVSKKYLEEKYGAKSLRFSSLLREALDCLGVENNRDNIIKLSTWSRESFGNDLLAKTITKKAKEIEAKIVVIDGARRPDDLIYLRKEKNFYLIAIEAETEKRYERSVLRNENSGDDKKSFIDFLKDQEKETEKTIPETMALADFVINNNDNVSSLYKKIDEILEKINYTKR